MYLFAFPSDSMRWSLNTYFSVNHCLFNYSNKNYITSDYRSLNTFNYGLLFSRNIYNRFEIQSGFLISKFGLKILNQIEDVGNSNIPYTALNTTTYFSIPVLLRYNFKFYKINIIPTGGSIFDVYKTSKFINIYSNSKSLDFAQSGFTKKAELFIGTQVCLNFCRKYFCGLSTDFRFTSINMKKSSNTIAYHYMYSIAFEIGFNF